jgi:hypothetical protein
MPKRDSGIYCRRCGRGPDNSDKATSGNRDTNHNKSCAVAWADPKEKSVQKPGSGDGAEEAGGESRRYDPHYA